MEPNDAEMLDSLFYTTLDVGSNAELVRVHKEFVSEPTPAKLALQPRGFFYPYQEQQRRYQRQHDRILVTHLPGTGKTFSAIGTAEALRGNYDPSLPEDMRLVGLPSAVRQYLRPERRNIKHVYYITANPILVNQARAVVPAVKDQLGMSKEDEEFYTFETYGIFMTEVSKQYRTLLRDNSKEEVERILRATFKEKYSDCHFILDEVHRLGGENVPEIAKGAHEQYQLYWWLVHSIERSVVELYTATPINNSTKELLPVANLLLSEDNQLTWDTNFDTLTDEELDELLAKYFSDNIFYVRAAPTGTITSYQGIKVEGTPFSYVPCEMIGKQLEQYVQAVRGELLLKYTNREGVAMKETKKDSLHNTEGMIGLSWAPIGTSTTQEGRRGVARQQAPVPIYRGDRDPVIVKMEEEHERQVREAMKDTTTRKEEKYEGVVRKLVDVRPYLFDVERMAAYGETPAMWTLDGGLRERACKTHFVLDHIKNNPRCVNLVIERFIVDSGMANFVAVALLNGYERYDEVLKSYVVGDRIQGLEKKKRVMVLESGMKPATLSMFLSLVGHPDNKYGEYVEIVVISPGMKIGISIYNVRKIFYMQAEWNPWSLLQGLSRGLREGGLKSLIEELASMGIRDPISIPIYLLAASVSDKDRDRLTPMMRELGLPRKFLVKAASDGALGAVVPERFTTLDEDQYALLGIKYRTHMRVINRIYSLAVMCYLNVDRNGQQFKCVKGPQVDRVYTSAYNVLYTRRHTWAIKEYIRRLMSGNEEPVHISRVISATRSYNIPLHVYYRAIAELVDEKRPFITKIGTPLYLNYDRERLYLQADYTLPTQHNFLMSYYGRYLPLTYSRIEDKVPVLSKQTLAEIKSIDDTDELRAYVRAKMNVGHQIALLETALLSLIDNPSWQESEWATVLEVYYPYWGRLAGNVSSAVLAHTLVSFWHEAGYSIIARLRSPNRYRYYVMSGGVTEWRTTGDRDVLASSFTNVYYRDKFAEVTAEVSEGYPSAYDTVVDGVFRVVAVPPVDEASHRGRKITSFSIVELLYILYKLDSELDPDEDKVKDNEALSYDNVLEALQELRIDGASQVAQTDLEQFMSFYDRWSGVTDKSYLVPVVEEQLRDQRRVLVA